MLLPLKCLRWEQAIETGEKAKPGGEQTELCENIFQGQRVPEGPGSPSATPPDAARVRLCCSELFFPSPWERSPRSPALPGNTQLRCTSSTLPIRLDFFHRSVLNTRSTAEQGPPPGSWRGCGFSGRPRPLESEPGLNKTPGVCAHAEGSGSLGSPPWLRVRICPAVKTQMRGPENRAFASLLTL